MTADIHFSRTTSNFTKKHAKHHGLYTAKETQFLNEFIYALSLVLYDLSNNSKINSKRLIRSLDMIQNRTGL